MKHATLTHTNIMPNRLDPVHFELGVNGVDCSFNPVLSSVMPGMFDPKFALPCTQEEGMNDFIVVHSPDPFLMNHNPEQEHTLHFLKVRKFIQKS